MTGAMVSSPQIGRMRESHNDSENINDWDPTEFRNFVKWFIEVHHPEAVKQYQAIRAIERKAEEAARVEAEIAQAEFLRQYWANQAKGAQNAYVPLQGAYITSATQQTPPKKSFWERCKELAKRPRSHGDYY